MASAAGRCELLARTFRCVCSSVRLWASQLTGALPPPSSRCFPFRARPSAACFPLPLLLLSGVAPSTPDVDALSSDRCSACLVAPYLRTANNAERGGGLRTKVRSTRRPLAPSRARESRPRLAPLSSLQVPFKFP